MAPGVKCLVRTIGLAGVLAVLAAPALAHTADAAGLRAAS
jgi:hypothetical protein